MSDNKLVALVFPLHFELRTNIFEGLVNYLVKMSGTVIKEII